MPAGTRAAVGARRLRRRTRADLENLALTLSRPAARTNSIRRGEAPEIPGRESRCAPEGAHEVGQVAEAYVVGDRTDWQRAVRQQLCGTPQASTHQVLMWCHAGHAREQAQEVKSAHAALLSHLREIERLVRVRVEPQRHPYRTAAVARAHPDRAQRLARHEVQEPCGEERAGFTEVEVAAPLGHGLRPLGKHAELGYRRQGATAPELRRQAERIEQRRIEME